MPAWFDHLCYEGVRWYGFPSLTLGWSLRVEGQNNVPQTGPVLVVANHQSYFDPVLIGLASSRSFSFLARKSLFNNPLFGWYITRLGAVPVDQEGVGKEGIKTILRQLQEGKAVVVFPEGERAERGSLARLKPGIQLLIKRVGAPILPIGIAGAFDAWPRTQPLPIPAPIFLPAQKRRIAVSVGKPLDGERYAKMPREQVLDEMFLALQNVQEMAEKLRWK